MNAKHIIEALSDSKYQFTSLEIRNVHLPHPDPVIAKQLWNVNCRAGKVYSVKPASEKSPTKYVLDVEGEGILVPSLCHSHIHLDKCYILDQGNELVSGDFDEALKVTALVKARFEADRDDLYRRGTQLIQESMEAGVTSMRAHVEVDSTVNYACFRVAQRLQEEFRSLCDVQIAVFAQDPLYKSKDSLEPGKNLSLLQRAAAQKGVSAVGSAPYVEPSIAHARLNIDHILDIAVANHLHVDFHLDYTLSNSTPSLVEFLIAQLYERRWSRVMPGKRVTIGHATQLTLFTPARLRELRDGIADLPVSFIGLPQSDLYMMGRQDKTSPRGTLKIPQLYNEYGLDVAMSVNNVGNAFTPQGSPDPLALCPLGVAVYQTATPNDCRILLKAVSTASKRAIGDPEIPSSLFPSPLDPANFVLLHSNNTVQSAVLNPSYSRTTIKGGMVVAWRREDRWTGQPNVVVNEADNGIVKPDKTKPEPWIVDIDFLLLPLRSFLGAVKKMFGR